MRAVLVALAVALVSVLRSRASLHLEVLALRAKQSKPVIDEIRTWLMTQRALPRSSLGKAIAYTSGLWPGLVRFLGDPKIPLDTNGVERALRGVGWKGALNRLSPLDVV